jgi:hypothetical protein
LIGAWILLGCQDKAGFFILGLEYAFFLHLKEPEST